MIRTVLFATLFTLACAADAGEDNDSKPTHNDNSSSEVAPAEGEVFTPSDLADFAGQWEAVSDDGTNIETAEIEVTDAGASGLLKSLERGYYSGRTTVTAEVAFRGSLRDGALVIQAWDVNNGSEQSPIAGRAFRRDEYLIVRVGTGESGYARAGVPLVKSAEGSAPALKLANAIGGKIFSSQSEASGRGAFVGARMKLALCADGSIAYDASDVASTGGNDGVDMGSTTSRRGEWGIVLLAGFPTVKARWNGTGSSYSLTRYFRVEPRANGARVDGVDLSNAGSC